MNKFKEFCLKVKEFYAHNKLACTLGVSTFLLILSSFWQPFMGFVLLYLFVSMLFFDLTEIMCVNFYFLPFSGFLILFIAVSIFTFILVVARFIIDLVKKRITIYKLPLILTTAICVVFAAIFYEINSYGALQGGMIIAILFYFYIIFCHRKNIKAEKCCTYLLIGLTMSAAVGAFLYLIPAAKMFVFNDSDFGYRFASIRDRMFLYYGDGKRLTLLSFHLNHLVVYCAFAISFVIYEYLKKGKKRTILQNVIYIVGVICAISIGMLTLSKSFYIIFAIIVLYTIIMSIVIYRKKSLKIVLPILAVTAIFCGIFWNQLYDVIRYRFVSQTGSGLISGITTGRSDIWVQYLNETFSSIGKALFGVGLFTKEVVDIGAHNFYVMILNRFGIIGTIALMVLIWSYIRATGSKLKCSARSLFPLLIILILFMQEACVDERLYFFLLGIMLAFGEGESEEQNKKLENSKGNLEEEKIEKAEQSKEESPVEEKPAETKKSSKTEKSENQEMVEGKPKKVYKKRSNI